MVDKTVREWKKVFLNDLEYLSNEIKELLVSPAIMVLSGDLGAGKTTFCRHFFPDKELSSPTYSVITEADNVLHADLYRLKSEEEIIPLELELCSEGKTYLFFEWGKKYLRNIFNELGPNFNYYELTLSVRKGHDEAASSQESEEANPPSRDFQLISLDKNDI